MSKNDETWLDFESVGPALLEYVAFLHNVNKGLYSDWPVERLDARRKNLHDKVLEAFSKGRIPDWRDREVIMIDDIEKLATEFDENLKEMTYSAYLRILNRISRNTYRGIKPMYVPNFRIKERIDLERERYERFLAECEAIHEAWHKDREIFNSHFEKYEDKCYESFLHDYNGAKFGIKCAFEILDGWKKVPVEAMLEPSVKEYYYGSLDAIRRNKEKMAYLTMMCGMFHRDFLAGKTKWKVEGIDFGEKK